MSKSDNTPAERVLLKVYGVKLEHRGRREAVIIPAATMDKAIREAKRLHGFPECASSETQLIADPGALR